MQSECSFYQIVFLVKSVSLKSLISCSFPLSLYVYFLARPTNQKSMKVVRMLSEEPVYKRNYVVDYYPRHVESYLFVRKMREYGLFRDEHQDFKEEMKRLRALRGKVPPKKGEGKRAKK